MEFVLGGKRHSLDAATVRTRVTPIEPEHIQTHWVEIDGRRWPPKQALRLATGLQHEPFISHNAIRIFRRLGFATSPLPRESATSPQSSESATTRPPAATSPQEDHHTADEAVAAYRRLDDYFSSSSLTDTLTRLEAELAGADRSTALSVLTGSGFDETLIASALLVRQRVGLLDTLIHAAVIAHALPLILEPGETVLKRPSLGAGNDPERIYDLETTERVAEFKLSTWRGADGWRQRSLFADIVGLSLDPTGRRRQMYVVGDLPIRFLTTSRRNAAKTLSKSAIRLRSPGLQDDLTVSQYTERSEIEIIDLTTILSHLSDPGSRASSDIWLRDDGAPIL
jgi:hypothetical protein